MKQEFKDLHGSVKLLNEYRDKKRELKGNSKDIINVLCKSAEDAIRKQQEGAFRKVIESELKQFRTPKEKLKNIANNPDYHWIGELYPAVYTREKRIFFMSMDKFFLGNTTIIEPTYSFYNNDITKNAIIFIDEFDATRDRLLNQIITRGLENHIDYLGLFHRVYASLKTRDFPAELTTASKLQQAYLDEHKNAKILWKLLKDLVVCLMKHMTVLRCNIASKQKKMVRAIEVVILFLMTYSFIRYLREKMLLLI